MELAPAAGRRPRPDAQALTYVMVASAAVVIAVVGWAGGVTHSRGPVLPLGIAVFLAAGGWVLWRGRISPASAHLLTLAALLGGFTLIVSIGDPLLRTLAAGWNLLIPLVMYASLSRRALAGYGMASAAAGVLLEATLPGPPLLLALRLATMAGLIALPLHYFVKMRKELDRALANAREAAGRDSLTGLLNRRGLAEQFPDLARRCARRGDALAVVVFDLDHFKRINDTMGHAAGDDVLTTVARSMGACARAGDLVVRIGGEEVALLGAVAGTHEATELAQRLRRTVRDDGAAWGLTTSAGVAVSTGIASSATPGQLMGLLELLLADADRCLYQAKEQGRDRVVGPIPPSTAARRAGGADV